MPCIVLGCNSTTAWKKLQRPRRTFFSLPLKDIDLMEKWSDIINRPNRIWSPKDKICDLHFTEDLIKKCDEFIINGEKVIISRGCWRLKPGAIPTIPSPTKAKARKPRKNGSKSPEITAVIEPLSDEDGESNEDSSNPVEVAIHDVTDITIQLPSPSWKQKEPCATESHLLYCVEIIIVDGWPVIRKWAKIDFHSRRVEAGLFKSFCPQMVEEFISLETVNQALKRIHSASECCGISTEPNNQNGTEVIFVNGAWRSPTCALLIKESSSSSGPKEMCSFCQNAIKSINQNKEEKGTTILPVGIKRVYNRKRPLK